MATNRLTPHSTNTFWKIKPRELIADLALIGISILLSQSLSLYIAIGRQGSAIGLEILLLMAQFTLPWYLGYLYGRYLAVYGGFIRIFILIVSLLVFFAFLGSVGVFLNGLPKSHTMSGGADSYILVAFIWIIAIIASPFLAASGRSTGKACFVELTEADEDRSYLEIFSFCLYIILLCFGTFFFIHYLGKVLGIICSVIILLLVIFWHRIFGKIRDTSLVKLSGSIAIHAFPIIVLLTLTIWSFVSVQTALTDNLGNRFAFTRILYILTINGFIPLRLIQMFDPPLRILNLVVSIVSLAIFLIVIN